MGAPARHDDSLWPQFQKLCADNGGIVVEVGSRIVSPGSASKRPLFPKNTYVGVDIYKDDNTDIVGDAHALSTLLPYKADAVFSVSVLEHLAAPWLFALEINKVLPVGGLTFHSTHFHWPEHELPWDFFRFSDFGLRAIFSPLFGFETVQAAVFAPGHMGLNDNAVHPNMRNHPCWGGSAIIARKVAEPIIQVSGADMSLVYPAATSYPKPRAT
jgi:hypothetical protein